MCWNLQLYGISLVYFKQLSLLKLRQCEKATKFEKISLLFWRSLSNAKTSGRFSQIFVAFQENLNFKSLESDFNEFFMNFWMR